MDVQSKMMAQEAGDSLSKRLQQMEYFSWDRDKKYFEQSKGLPSSNLVGDGRFLEERGRLEREKALVKIVIPYIQYVKADNPDEAEGYIEQKYERVLVANSKRLRMAGVLTDGQGFPIGTSEKNKLENFEKFRQYFIYMAERINKHFN